MFSSEQWPEGIVAISKHTLRIISIARVGSIFNQVTSPLSHTPRKMAVDPRTNFIYSIEGDHNAVPASVLAQAAADIGFSDGTPLKVYGEPRYGRGRWSSNIRIFDPSQNQTVHLVQLDAGELATSIAVVRPSYFLPPSHPLPPPPHPHTHSSPTPHLLALAFSMKLN